MRKHMKRVPHETLDYTDNDLYYHDNEPFTGVAYFQGKGGQLDAEHEYREGMRWGVSKGWFGPGSPEYEEHWSQGLLHGLRREWHKEGRMIAEEMYERGIHLWGKRWDGDGNLVEDFRLEETDPDFDTLEMYRAAYKKAGLGQPCPPATEPGGH
jgi:antitoxin component YwqK of YwqJK toxin-antitoxin module